MEKCLYGGICSVENKDCNYCLETTEFKDKTLLITGGTGSLGTSFSKHILKKGIKKLIIYSRCWQKQNRLKEELSEYKNVRFFIGDIRDKERLNLAFKNVDYIIHAAAIKCIEACEYNVFECMKTNIMGTQNVIEAALNNNVEKTVFISTDKAVNPINSYGISKAFSENLILKANNLAKNDNFFNVIRYGNVIGSSGSIIPKYLDLIKNGAKELPVTNPLCTRYWFEMNEALELIETGFLEKKDTVIIPENMKSFRVTDIVKALGKKIKIIGLRKKEKLHEEINYDESSQINEFVSIKYIKEYIGDI